MLGFAPLSSTPFSALPNVIVQGVANAAGAATATGASNAIHSGIGAASGAATVNGYTTGIFAVAGHAAGAAAVIAGGALTAAATGTAEGVAIVDGRDYLRAVGTAEGAALVDGIGHSTAAGRGTADGRSTAQAVAINAAIPSSPQPWFPSFPNMLMPESALDGMIRNVGGVRLGWMRSHQCGCTLGADIPGSPNPNCNTCHGRGVFWENWTEPFVGLITYMHTSSAPDEPGAFVDKFTGQSQYADPTLTIPFRGPGIEAHIWRNASEFDAYVELDATSRYTAALMVGDTSILPYQQQLDVQNVYVYDPVAQRTYLLGPNEYFVTGSSVTLDPSFPAGTGYTVEYMACPVYIAYRRAGGLPHTRPFGGGTGQIPRRFRIVALDIWSRARKDGFGGLAVTAQALQ